MRRCPGPLRRRSRKRADTQGKGDAMNDRRCDGVNKDGGPCSARGRPGRPYCLWHDPDLAERRDAWNRQGGKNKANAVRARKAIPEDLRDVGDLLLAAIADVQAGTLETGRGNAVANLARAYVSVFQYGDVERRFAEIEAKLREKLRERSA